MKAHNFRKKAASRLNGKKMYIARPWDNLKGFVAVTGLSAVFYGYSLIPSPELISPLVAIHPVETAEASKIVVITPQPTQTPTKSVITKIKPKASQSEVVALIEEIWGKDAEIGKKIAFCESSWGLNNTNPESSATGVYQIIKSTWIGNRKSMGENTDLSLRFDPRENIKTAYYLYQRRGTQPWDASKWCWSK